MADANIVVLGAGVVGLTTALLLSQNPKYSVTIVAKHMPGDYDIGYASPWAGANYLPVGKPGSNLARYEEKTWPELQRLASSVVEAGVHFQETVLHNRQKDVGSTTGDWFAELLKTDPWWKAVVPNFRILPRSTLAPGIDSATAFTSVCINTAIYLPWLAGQCLKNGAVIKRGTVTHIASAATLHHSGKPAAVVLNCTGLSAMKLGGVMDKTMYPGRGQIVVVRNEPGVMTSSSGTDDGPDEACYIMQRAAGGGTILGGCLQKGNWDSQPDPSMALRIMQRAVKLCPALTEGEGIEKLDVVRHGVGLRPMREGGPRVERERVRGLWVVHNYGHAGYGYQASYGSAEEAVGLVEEALRERARL
ncbi:D-amino-acid oxidase [Saccharata proteae CBS 121410]|uniref:D-amino-acid oxidase n=1 Tax=Saccharata proteae CBS 121410 TaxID=1314787 RepID=A0A9P4HPK7_9PEZI|nr:D-amino-acid oxidase [Saccharata proteae CBS 121410]